MMFDPRLAAALMMPPAMYDPGSAATLALLASGGQTAKLFASPPNRLDDQPKDSKAPSAPPNRANGSNASFRIETLLDQPGPPTTFAPGSSNAATAAMFGIPEPTTMQQQQQMAVQHILAQMGALGPLPMSMGAAAEHHQQQQQQQGGSCGGNNGTGNRLDLANISPLEATRGDSPLLARNSSPRSSAPETPSGESSGGGGGKKTRKARTIFTDKQLQELENMFERHKYLSVQDRMDLARRMNLSDTQVKTWYQNRRTKWKRQTQTGQELLQEHNLVAVQQIIRANPHFWAPLMVGQMAAAQQAQHSQFAQRFLSNPAAATFGMASAQLEAAENVQQPMGNGAAIVEEREEKSVVNGTEEKPGQQAEGRRKAEKRRADREVAEEEAELLLLEHTKRAKWEPKEEQNGGGGEHHQDGHRQS